MRDLDLLGRRAAAGRPAWPAASAARGGSPAPPPAGKQETVGQQELQAQVRSTAGRRATGSGPGSTAPGIRSSPPEGMNTSAISSNKPKASNRSGQASVLMAPPRPAREDGDGRRRGRSSVVGPVPPGLIGSRFLRSTPTFFRRPAAGSFAASPHRRRSRRAAAAWRGSGARACLTITREPWTSTTSTRLSGSMKKPSAVTSIRSSPNRALPVGRSTVVVRPVSPIRKASES